MSVFSGAAMFIGYGVLIAVVTCKFLLDGAHMPAVHSWPQKHKHTELLVGTDRAIYNNYYIWASIAVAAACLLALLVRGSIFAARIVSNVRQGNHWCGPRFGLQLVASFVFSADVLYMATAATRIMSPSCQPTCSSFSTRVRCSYERHACQARQGAQACEPSSL